MGSAYGMNRSDAILEAEDPGTDHQRQPLDLTVCLFPLYSEASGICWITLPLVNNPLTVQEKESGSIPSTLQAQLNLLLWIL
jgi:hypothetical protein